MKKILTLVFVTLIALGCDGKMSRWYRRAVARAWDIYFGRVDFEVEEGGTIKEVRKSNAMFPTPPTNEAPPINGIDWFGDG